MRFRIINQSLATTLISMETCIGLMSTVLGELERGKAAMPLRSVMRIPETRNVMGMMPAYLDVPKVMGIKVISVFPGNETTRYESHQGGVLLFEMNNGLPLALVDASAITTIRTAAVSAVATRLLARGTAADLAILGSGTQAWSHLEAMLLVRGIHRVRVWSRNPVNAMQFSKTAAERFDIDIVSPESIENTLTGADLICTTTASPEPVLPGHLIAGGAHINAVGACLPHTRELDSEAIRKSLLFVDRRESVMNESGDFLIPVDEGVIDTGHIRGEIGELIEDRIPGRRSESDITVFKSLGLAVEDIAVAHHLYMTAEKADAGIVTDFEGIRVNRP
ncbi:MAG: ornithine cyclodeaminase family protein [Desulfobacteraceae bacterium]|nr:ornithine cyclodeaminase family protein [Desulfobacteraceae bacterium]